jgi:putative phosphoribosyl transferase
MRGVSAPAAIHSERGCEMPPPWRWTGRRDTFRDRIDAGERLAERLASMAGGDALVLGLPRGGVPVAAEVARALGAELDVLVARKVGAPRQPELAVGAVTADGGVYLDTRLIDHLHIPASVLDQLIARERATASERDWRFRGDRPFPVVEDRTVIVADDGLATGATMHAAVHALRKRGPGRVIVAAPVGAPASCAALGKVADACVCLLTPRSFQAVGQFYEDFTATTDAEVDAILRRFHPRGPVDTSDASDA